MNEHEIFIQRCLSLANEGAGMVSPNPMVGAVLVYDGKVIGEGYHRAYGEAHAEVNCLNSVREKDRHLISKSTLYVSLEPCNHTGKTPPCTELIIHNDIPRVVVATADPFEKVNGSGIQRLLDHGIEVVTGVCRQDAQYMNKRFFTYHQQKRPYVILKWAQSSNGKIAAAEKKPVKISHEITDRLVHRWRSEEAAILVGTQTVLSDDPSLTNRLWTGRNPVRVVIDRNLSIPSTMHVFDQSVPTIIINSVKDAIDGKTVYRKTSTDITVSAILDILYQEQINAVLVEGGATLLQSFIQAGLWDEARVITNTALHIPDGFSSPEGLHGIAVNREMYGTDEIVYYTNNKQV